MDDPGAYEHLIRLFPEEEPWLHHFPERVTDKLQASGSGDEAARIHQMALTALIETGVSPHGAAALMLFLMPGAGEKDLKVTDPHILTLLRGIRAVEALNTRRANLQSENFMKMLLLLAEEMQALLAVLGHRIWQLRHFDTIPDSLREALLSDLEHLYLPLTHRLGLYRIKSEMEDFVMLQKHPDIYGKISRDLADTEQERHRYIERFIAPLNERLRAKGFAPEIRYRIKSVASIWRKMRTQQVGLEEVFDVFAIRIIDPAPEGDEKRRCWEIYSLVTDLYPPDPERLRDWISVPRPSGYESLHTTVKGPGSRWVEVQIRTLRMDRQAEEGPAAHWRYKEGAKKDAGEWLARARKLLEAPVEADARGMHNPVSGEIFTVTPGGDLVRLKKGATILDFAFEVHSDVGLRCKGAVVNGKMMPIRHTLANGDKVEVLTAKTPNVSEDWLKIVISSKARNRIRKALQERKDAGIMQGKELLERKLRQWKAGSLDEKVNWLMQHFRIRDAGEFYRMIAEEKITTARLRDALAKEEPSQEDPVRKEILPPLEGRSWLTTGEEVLMINDEMPTRDYQLAKCCNPVFGDEIFGFVTVGKGIRIHRIHCPNAAEMKTRYPYRIIPSRWTHEPAGGGIQVALAVTGRDRLGIIRDITDVLSGDLKVMTRSATFEAVEGRFKGTIQLIARDNPQIGWIIKKIRRINGVEKVTRQVVQSY
ncbi:MAG TPA: TGS domain-containing protein [Bacteroidales bacterium]|nr:TGS domain-containing protein [Bacteroidales bacterium]HRZ48176.1 TGS domain-containing protein [Bacteroidales bacterium]